MKFYNSFSHSSTNTPTIGTMRALPAVVLVLLVAIIALGFSSCGGDEQPVKYVLKQDSTTANLGDQAPPLPAGGVVHRLKTHMVPGRLKNIFNDSNHIQLPVAQAHGIAPITDFKSAYYLKQPIERLYTTNLYYVDSMKHAMPYLVPKAATLLRDIAQAFHDTIIARGGKDYRLRVTSMLRTDYSVARLQKRNRAATSQSCHLYGTTFDISWVKFDCMDPTFQVSLESLKNILAEIIYDFRERGRCYAIFENRQGCFHITVRK